MIDLDYKEYETFKTPDGEEWEIRPLLVQDIKLVLKFTDINEKQNKLKKADNRKELMELIYTDFVEIANELIDKGVFNKKTGETLPEVWRAPYIKMVELAAIIIQATMGSNDGNNDEGDTPFGVPKKSSKASGAKSTASKKKDGVKKKSN